jgi:hypothetical protein
MADNSELTIIRRWIGNQRVEIGNQITALQGKLVMLNQMERELLNGSAPPMPGIVRSYHRTRAGGSKAQKQAMLALEAAGPSGLTSYELADVAHMPKGTASSRLLYMQRDGLVQKNGTRYFIVHSTQEDNNRDQGQ